MIICSSYIYTVFQLWLMYICVCVPMGVYMHGNDVFKYISTALYYICNNKIYYTHKSTFQFKHAFNLEDLGKQMSMCKDTEAYTQTSKKGGPFAITHTYVRVTVYTKEVSPYIAT